jgi:hypothetical protein
MVEGAWVEKGVVTEGVSVSSNAASEARVAIATATKEAREVLEVRKAQAKELATAAKEAKLAKSSQTASTVEVASGVAVVDTDVSGVSVESTVVSDAGLVGAGSDASERLLSAECTCPCCGRLKVTLLIL